MEARQQLPKKPVTLSGKIDFEKVSIPHAEMSHAYSDHVAYNHANLLGVNFQFAELSLCEFHGTNLAAAKLNQAILICSSFADTTIFSNETQHADVDGCLFLLSTSDAGKAITREWLKNKGAANADCAITNVVELTEMLDAAKIEIETAKHYSDKITVIYELLNSMKIRKKQSMFINPAWLPLLQHSTQDNLDVLKDAFVKLDQYIYAPDQKAINEAMLQLRNRF